jgi:hypothetical protein
MRPRDLGVLGVAVLGGLGATGCHPAADESSSGHGPAARVEAIEGGGSRLVLTQRAVERLGLLTAPVRVTKPAVVDISKPASGAGRATTTTTTVPYAAVLFDPQGRTWTYTAGPGLSFVRHQVTVERFDDDRALLVDGPPVGTQVVTVGAAELFGTELDVGH